MTIINDKFNGVRIVQREDGKYGIEDLLAGGVSYRYTNLYAVTKTAQFMSDENDRIDQYEAAHK